MYTCRQAYLDQTSAKFSTANAVSTMLAQRGYFVFKDSIDKYWLMCLCVIHQLWDESSNFLEFLLNRSFRSDGEQSSSVL